MGQVNRGQFRSGLSCHPNNIAICRARGQVPSPSTVRYTAAALPMDCPSDDVLEAFIKGRLPDGEQQAVLEHVGECAKCSGRAGRIAREDDQMALVNWAEAADAELLRRGAR